MECSEPFRQSGGVWQELGDGQCLAGCQPICNRDSAVPLDSRIGTAGRGFEHLVHSRKVYVFHLSRPAGRGDELGDPCLAGIGIQNSDENGPVESGVGRQPFVDVPVTSETDLCLIAIGKLRCHGNPSVVDWLGRLIGAVKKG
jgi:hypothetical protein